MSKYYHKIFFLSSFWQNSKHKNRVDSDSYYLTLFLDKFFYWNGFLEKLNIRTIQIFQSNFQLLSINFLLANRNVNRFHFTSYTNFYAFKKRILILFSTFIIIAKKSVVVNTFFKIFLILILNDYNVVNGIMIRIENELFIQGITVEQKDLDEIRNLLIHILQQQK